jgi:hypothetical protein
MSASVVMKVQPATVDMTGIEFTQYGNYYLAAAEYLARRKPETWFDPLPYQLLCQSLELHLKSFIWLKDRLSRRTLRNKYGHDLERLWLHAKEQGVVRYCTLTPARESAIALLDPFYKDRKFAYLDLSMTFEGIPKVRADPGALRTVLRLCRQLKKSLHKPILNAS